jgi:hypothetical protein
MSNSQFINYMINPLSYEQMHLLYKANDIKYDRCNLYYDFIKTLNKVIHDTYLGSDFISTEREIMEHFEWCFNNVLELFREEKIKFDSTDKIKDYFFYFYFELFYKDKTKSLEKLNRLADFSFDYDRLKSRSDIDIMFEIYKMLDKSVYFKTKK